MILNRTALRIRNLYFGDNIQERQKNLDQNIIYPFLHAIVASQQAGPRQNRLNPVWALVVDTRPADYLGKIVDDRPRRARHLAQVACLLTVQRIGGHSGGGGNAGGRAPAYINPLVLNCHCFYVSLLEEKKSLVFILYLNVFKDFTRAFSIRLKKVTSVITVN